MKINITLQSTIITCALFMITNWGYAQTISGDVTDSEDGMPLAGATIIHVNSGLGTATDSSGAYSLTQIPTGTSLIRVTYTGYQSYETTVTLSESETYTLDVQMVSGVSLEQVLITASRRPEKILDAPASTDIILSQELTQKTGPSTITALRNVTGLDIAQIGIDRHEVVLRGFSNVFSGATLIMTDYRDAGTASLGVNLHSVMPNISVDLDRVEIVRGPGSALYGPGVDSGVIHYITKDAFSHPGATIALSGGARSYANIEWRVAETFGKFVGVKVTGSYSEANDFELESCSSEILALEQFNQCPDVDDAVQIFVDGERDTDQKKFTVNTNIDFKLGERTQLSLNGGIGQFSGTVLSGIGTLQAIDFNYSFVQARLSSGGLFAQFYTNVNNSGRSYVYGGDPVVEYSNEYVMQAQYDLQLGSWQSLILGADFDLTRPDTRGTVLGRNEDNDNINEYGVYGQSTSKITNQLELTLALRGDYNNVVETVQLSPRIGLVVKPSPRSSIRATYNRSFSSPTATSNWLDLVAAQLPGGINVRGRGAATGFTYLRNPDYLALGAPTDLVASSLIPGFLGADTPAGISTGLIYSLLHQQLVAIPDEDIALLLAGAGLNIPVPLIATLKQLLGPESTVVEGFSSGVLGSLNLSTLNIDLNVSDLLDAPPLKQTISQTYEVGYKGLIGEKLVLAADIYYAKKKNFQGALQVRTPFVLVPQLSQDLIRDITTGVTNNTTLAAALGLFGVTPEQVAQLLVDVAGQSLPSPQTPIAIVQPNENNPGVGMTPEMMLSYPNFGNLDYFGADLSVQILLSPEFSMFGNMSWVSDDFFDHTELGEELEDRVIALNASSFKFKLGGQYESQQGFNVNLGGRYVKGFPVRSGPYEGDVPSYFILDLGAGYVFSPAIRLDLGINNATDSNHREFVGAPKLGRTANVRLTYTTGWK
ncbi:MAG: TonB-dependent receptor [Bacteroidetes bacterium]|nr:TonB-dependent receptor [Bacteroidota bacterium]